MWENDEGRNCFLETRMKKLVQWVMKGFVRRVAFESYRHKLDYADLYQAGFVGLIEAANRYDPSKGKFVTYAVWYIKNAIRKEIQRSHVVSINANAVGEVWRNESNEQPRFECARNAMNARNIDLLPEDEIERLFGYLWRRKHSGEFEDHDVLMDAVRKLLTNHQLEIIRLRFPCGEGVGAGFTIREVAKLLGVTFQAVNFSENLAFKKLRRHLYEDEEGRLHVKERQKDLINGELNENKKIPSQQRTGHHNRDDC